MCAAPDAERGAWPQPVEAAGCKQQAWLAGEFEKLFLDNLDPVKYRTDFETDGSCNYAFTLVLKNPDAELARKAEEAMRQAGVEFRRGTAGGGNQLRQPYARKLVGDREFEKYPEVDHVHFYGYYIGNYPDLDRKKIFELCGMLNQLG